MKDLPVFEPQHFVQRNGQNSQLTFKGFTVSFLLLRLIKYAQNPFICIGKRKHLYACDFPHFTEPPEGLGHSPRTQVSSTLLKLRAIYYYRHLWKLNLMWNYHVEGLARQQRGTDPDCFFQSSLSQSSMNWGGAGHNIQPMFAALKPGLGVLSAG